jgi:excisionase family DNA binding protein
MKTKNKKMIEIVVTDSKQIASIVQEAVALALSQLGYNLPSESAPEKEFLNLKEAAELLNLAPQTIYGQTSAGKIPFLKRGKKLMFERKKLVELLKAC